MVGNIVLRSGNFKDNVDGYQGPHNTWLPCSGKPLAYFAQAYELQLDET